MILSFPTAISAAASCFGTMAPVEVPGNIIPPTTPGGSLAAFVLPGFDAALFVLLLLFVAPAASSRSELFNFGLIKRRTISRQTAYCCVGTNTSGVIPVP